MAKLKSEVVEVIGDRKEFRDEINYELSNLDGELVSINVSTSETRKGTKYVAVLLYKRDNGLW